MRGRPDDTKLGTFAGLHQKNLNGRCAGIEERLEPARWHSNTRCVDSFGLQFWSSLSLCFPSFLQIKTRYQTR